jgi:DNA-binding IclR family transcriptional regulator
VQNPASASAPASAAPTAREDRHFVTALSRGLEVLSVFRPQDRVLGNQELARRTRLPKSTVSRLTYTLTRLGYLEPAKDAGGGMGYRLGSRVLALGSTLLQGLDIRAQARPHMQQLADQTLTMVALGTPERRSMIYIEACRSEPIMTLRLNVGSRIPMALTAMGRAYLSICSESERGALMQQFRQTHPDQWAAVEDGILRSLQDYQQLGCCTSFTEWQGHVNAIAVAFRVPGQPPLALSCGGPAYQLGSDYMLQEVRPRLLEAVRCIQALGLPA